MWPWLVAWQILEEGLSKGHNAQVKIYQVIIKFTKEDEHGIFIFKTFCPHH